MQRRSFSTFRDATNGIHVAMSIIRNATFGAALATSALLGFPAAAQQAFSLTQCRDALVVGNAILSKYAVSQRLASSFKNFRLSGCNPKTVFERENEVDEDAFGEFRIKLIALRTEAAQRSLPQQ